MYASKTLYTMAAVASSAAGVTITEKNVEAPSVISLFLDALGITLGGPQFFAGLFFAIAGAFLMLSHKPPPPEERTTKWATLLAGIFMGTSAAIGQSWAATHVNIRLEDFPPQLFMGGAGLFSRHLVMLTSPDTLVKFLLRNLK